MQVCEHDFIRAKIFQYEELVTRDFNKRRCQASRNHGLQAHELALSRIEIIFKVVASLCRRV